MHERDFSSSLNIYSCPHLLRVLLDRAHTPIPQPCERPLNDPDLQASFPHFMHACHIIQAYSYHQPEATARRTHSADLADFANSALVLSVILRAVERTSEASLARVDGGV